MIIGNIHHLDLVPFLPYKLKTIIEHLKENLSDYNKIGRYELDEDRIFFMVSDNETRLNATANPEFHHRYIDIHIILQGSEGIAVTTQKANTQIIEDALQEKDIAFITTPANEIMLTLNKHDFLIVYPKEVHKPLCRVDDSKLCVRKIVVKIDLAILTD